MNASTVLALMKNNRSNQTLIPEENSENLYHSVAFLEQLIKPASYCGSGFFRIFS